MTDPQEHSLCTVTEGRREGRSRARTTLLLRDVRGAKCQRCDSNEEETFTGTWNANEGVYGETPATNPSPTCTYTPQHM